MCPGWDAVWTLSEDQVIGSAKIICDPFEKMAFEVFVLSVCLHIFRSNSGLKLPKRPDIIHDNHKYILALIKT